MDYLMNQFIGSLADNSLQSIHDALMPHEGTEKDTPCYLDEDEDEDEDIT